MRLIKKLTILLFCLFVLPAGLSFGWWALQERPSSWRMADWKSASILPPANKASEAAIYVLAARTGGLKGAVSVHSWIVIKREGTNHYDRYDKLGWGVPVRRNAYEADGKWYSNTPYIVHGLKGQAAERLIPGIEQAISTYPFSRRGDYRIWPGPNSNSFVAHVLRAVPELGASMPALAIGRDYPSDGSYLDWDEARGDLRLSFSGYVGLSMGRTAGFEINFLGLVAGMDFAGPALKIPGFGRVGLGTDAPFHNLGDHRRH